jgi:hypothetical protein
MKNAILYKNHWLMKNSTSYHLFELWKATKDEKLAQKARKNFEEQFRTVLVGYDKLMK